jgi:hypothetical protein
MMDEARFERTGDLYEARDGKGVLRLLGVER